tara:strand:- start:1012 stop:1647 length:636 start_codon:yes stop_codon:yes gene_type:complete
MAKRLPKTTIKKAIELLATQPDITAKEAANQLGIHEQTIVGWKKNPEFVDAIYDTYMVQFGTELPGVLQAMINQGKAGNVQAARLVLEHSGKLVKNINITVDSPFEKFLKKDATPIEYKDAEIQDIVDDIPDIPDIVLPEPINEDPVERKKQEVIDIKKEISRSKRSLARRKMYKLRKRAEDVGLEPLGKKPSALEKENWLKEIERRENEN